MPSNDRLSEFAAVAAEGSISSAARVLGVERATLSRRMSGLEAELGVRLFHRSSGRLVLTRAGEELHRRARRIERDTHDAWSAVRRMDDVPRGVLRVSTIGDTLDDLILRFVQEFPEVRIELLDTARQVGLIAEQVDVAIRIGPIADENVIARRVDAGVDRVVVGSSDYLARCGRPASPDDLVHHRCITGLTQSWPLRAGGAVIVDGPIAANGSRLMLKAAREGVGLTFLPVPLIREDLASGALVPILEGVVGDTAQVSVVFAERDYIDAKVRMFIDRAVPVLEAAYGERSSDASREVPDP